MDEYERYKLLWMLAHGYSLRDLMDQLFWLQDKDSEDIRDVFYDWQCECGFGGEIWACREEWKRCEANEIVV